MGNYSPGEVLIACKNCDSITAQQSCLKNYHLCTDGEFLTGVGIMAKIMGWVRDLLNVCLMRLE